MEKSRSRILGCLVLSLAVASCGTSEYSIPPSRWDHILVVWEENKDASEVADLPYIAQLRTIGRTYSRAYGVTRPSQPNYFAVFAGSTMGVTDNGDHDLSGPTLHSRYADAGLSMESYAEGLPYDGFRGTSSGKYVRKHNPAASFPAVPDAAITSFSNFPSDFSALPRLAFVIPDLDDDMHDGAPSRADDWLRDKLGAYVQWARTHRSLFILAFDEPNVSSGLDAPILIVFVGEGIEPGTVEASAIDLYDLSDYLLGCYGLARLRP